MYCPVCDRRREQLTPWEHDQPRSVYVCRLRCGHLRIVHQDTFNDGYFNPKTGV